MPRPKAFTDSHFIRSLPNRESEAITEKELIERVGCGRATANNWLRDKVNAGIVSNGHPGYMGALTYYLVSARPEISLPRITNAKDGKQYDVKQWLTTAMEKDSLDDKSRVIVLSILRLWQGALNEDEKFSEVNQEVRAAIQKERAAIKMRLAMYDSLMTDPFLSGDSEMVQMAEDAMRGVSADITAEQVNDKYNALRAL